MLGIKVSKRGFIDRRHGFPVFKGVKNAVVNFQCNYDDTVSLEKSQSIDDGMIVSDGIVAKGSFSSAFTMEIYSNQNYSTAIDIDDVLIGQMLYPEISWEVSGLYNTIAFYVKNCAVFINDQSLEIVQNNCYSAAVGASLMSTSHLQQQRSRFSFRSFSSVAGSDHQRLICDISLCLINSIWDCSITTKEDSCPTGPLDYHLMGYNMK